MLKDLGYKLTFLFLMIVNPVLLTAQQSYIIMGKVSSIEKDSYNITFNCENGKVRLSFLTEDLLRIHMAPSGNFPEDDLHLGNNGPYAVVNYTWPGVDYSIKEEFDYELEGEVYNISAGKLIVKVRKNPFKLAIYDNKEQLLLQEKPGIVNAGLGYTGTRVYETMSLPVDEHFFGFGAYNHPLDMRGNKIICYPVELERDEAAGGFPVPFFYSSKGYGIFFNNLDDDVTFEMGTIEGEYSFSGTNGGKEGWDMDYYFIYGPKFGNILNRYTDIVGKPILPEKWFFGHIQNQCCNWTADKVIEVALKFRAGNWPADILIIDFQAMGHNFVWDSTFSNYKEMFDKLDTLGFKTALSCALFDDIYDWESFDPTQKLNNEKYWSYHIPRIKEGIDFWRQDNSERSINYTGLQTLGNGYESHNLFGSLWAKTVVEGMESMGLFGRPVISRGGPVGGHRYIIPWPGDTPYGLECLDIDLNFIRNGSISGYSSISVDLGGFKDRGNGKPLEEQNVIRRVINMLPIVPVSKLQGEGDEGAKLPWLLTLEQQDLYRFYLNFRYRLLPYRYSSAIEASLTGRPLLAPIVFDYQDDVNTYNKDFHFMLGKSILVAPVMGKKEEWKVYLPEGKWIHYWTGDEYAGNNTVTVKTPLYGKDGLPVFVKAGSIIPMMPQMSYIYEKAPNPLTLDIYPVKNNKTEYILNDIKNLEKPLKIEKTIITCFEDEENIDVSISPSVSDYEIWIHMSSNPSSVMINNMNITELENLDKYNRSSSGWYYGPGCFFGSDKIKTLNIKIPRQKKSFLVRVYK